MSLEQQVLDKIQSNTTAAERKKKEDQKYQERLPWESTHISPYIPKLEKIGFKNDYYVPDVHNYEITNSFQPFFKQVINPIRKGEEDYSEYIKNLDEEEQARYTMDKFREFLAENSRPQLSTESGLMNMRYRDKLLNMLDHYKKVGVLPQKESQKNLNNSQILQSNSNQQTPAMLLQGSASVKAMPYNAAYTNQMGSPFQQASPTYQNATPTQQRYSSNIQNSKVGISPIGTLNQIEGQTNTNIYSKNLKGSASQQQINPYQSQGKGLPSQNFRTIADLALNKQKQQQTIGNSMPQDQIIASPSYQQNDNFLQYGKQQKQSQQQYSTLKPESQQQYQLQQQYGLNQQSQLFQRNEEFNSRLCFDYEKILISEGKLKKGQNGQSWNNISEQYLQKLLDWGNDNDNWIQDQLLQNKDVRTMFFLQPRVFRQVRPIDKVKREVIRTEDGQYIPFETVVERRSVEVMHQRDYLIKPMLIPNVNGELEIVHDVFCYDRSFIIEQNPLTKSEILHEYPIHLDEDQFLDFLFQTGISVRSMDHFIPAPPMYDQNIYTVNNPQQTYQLPNQGSQYQPLYGSYQQPYFGSYQQPYFGSQQQPQYTSQQQLFNSQKEQKNQQNLERSQNKKTTKKINQTKEKQQFDYEKYKKEELQRYFMDQKDTIKGYKQQPTVEPFEFQGSKINLNNNKDSQISFDYL